MMLHVLFPFWCYVNLGKRVSIHELYPMMLRCLSLKPAIFLGIWELGGFVLTFWRWLSVGVKVWFQFKVTMVGWNSAGLKTMEIIKVTKIEEGLKWQPFIGFSSHCYPPKDETNCNRFNWFFTPRSGNLFPISPACFCKWGASTTGCS